MVVPDRSGEPLHDASEFEIARGAEGGVEEIPFLGRVDPGPREDVLGVEKVGAGGGGDPERQETGEDEHGPASGQPEPGEESEVGEQHEGAGPVLAGICQGGPGRRF